MTKQKITRLVLSLGVIFSVGAAVLPVSVDAAPTQKCGGATTSIISCPQNNTGTSPQNNGIWGILLIALNIMTAGIGIAAVGGVVYAAILYTTASDRASQVQQAKDILQNIAIGIGAYAGMYLLLNFLVPGGIFT